MRIAQVTVARPVFTTMMALIAVLVGAFSLTRLPIDLMPDISFPTLTIQTAYPGAAPEEIEEGITRRIEEAVSTVSGIEEVTSTSSEGNSTVRVTFQWGMNLDAAANDIRDRLDAIVNALPQEANRPQLRKFDVTQFPIMILGISSDMDPVALRMLIEEQIAHRIERIPGVAALDVWGGLQREIQVRVDPDRLYAMDLSLDSIRQSLREANITVPAGTVERGRLDVSVRTPGQFTSLQQVEDVVVARRSGATVRLGQLAEVADSHERIQRVQRINGQPGVRVAVRKQDGSNTVQVANDVRAAVERIQRDFPQLSITPVTDQSGYIQQSISNLSSTLLYGGVLAVLVLLFFLRNLRGTLAVATAIPISVITTFALIYFGGFTLNLMTLGGLALGVGLMVDNAIVVLENITRLREQEGRDRREAAIVGTAQVGPAIVASTATTLIIFAPLFFSQGISGEMFRQLAFTVAFALSCSLLVALTVVPMLASRLLRDDEPEPGSGFHPMKRLSASLGRGFQRLEDRYRRVLVTLLANRGLTIGAAALSLVVAVALMPRIGGEFMPQTDESEVRINVDMEPGTRLEVLDRVMRRIEAIVDENVPEQIASETSIGSGWQGGVVSGSMQIALVGPRERSRSSNEIAASLRPLLDDLPGAQIRTRAGQGLFLLRMGSGGGDGEPLEVEVRGFEMDRLDGLAQDIQRGMDAIPGISDTRVSREEGVPQELMVLDRARAADLGVSVERAARTLEAAIAGVRAGDFTDRGRDYRIRLQLRDAETLTQDEILNLTVPTGANGTGSIALRNIVRVEEGLGPQQIERKDQQRMTVVYGNISGRDLGSVAADVREMLRSMPMPEGYEAFVGGEFEQQQDAFGELGMAMLLAVLLVYMVLASLYESFRDPLIVMFTVPLSIVGVNLMLFATDTTYNLQSLIGMIMLVGIVVNNSILIVDQTATLRRDRGLSPYDAVIEAGRRRLRPVLMTSLTTTFALLPLAIGLGEGAEAQAPMARAVIGGLLSASLVTLLVIPVIYTLMHRDATSPQAASEEALARGTA